MNYNIIASINGTIKLILSVLLISACSAVSEKQQESPIEEEDGTIVLTQAQYDLSEIQMGRAEVRTIGSELKVNGAIDVPPQSQVSIHMPYGGFVKHIRMLPGTWVKKGQFLVSVENPEFIQFQQDYLEGIANREYLKNEFERQQKLYDENVASGKTFQQAKSQFLANEARIKTMEARLRLIGFKPSDVRLGEVSAVVNIYAPVTGSVREVYVNVGKYINPQDVILDITNSDDLHVELTVYENDIIQVKEGQRIRFSIANSSEVWREAEVFLVGSGVREDRSVTVHGHLKKKQNDLIPGMYVVARIETGSRQVWCVPETAVVRYAGKHYVFVADSLSLHDNEQKYQFKMVAVEKGVTEDDYTEIRQIDDQLDLSGVQLVTQGAFVLLAKAKNVEEVD